MSNSSYTGFPTGTASNIERGNITQSAHGFSVGQAVYFNGTIYALAKANAASTSDVIGVVSNVLNVDTFSIVISGAIILSGLTVGQYFLSDVTAGLLTLTPPSNSSYGSVRKPIMEALSVNSANVHIQLGIVISPIISSDFGSITTGTNTAATMTVGSGATLISSGSGVIDPSTINGKIGIGNTVDFSLTGSGTTASPYVFDETTAFKGGRSDATSRFQAMSVAGQHQRMLAISGNYYDQAFTALAPVTVGQGTGQLTLTPFVPQRDFTIDQIGVNVTTGSAATNCKVVIYSNNANNQPDTLIHATPDLSSATSATYIFESYSYTFNANTVYWIGVHCSSSAVTLRGLPIAAFLCLGMASNVATAYYGALSRTISYASGPPSTWSFVSTDLYSNSIASIRMRAA